mmetsp:Transcript_6944/g.25057  ORF Transcript_6944/g.25057 Transcript_6944/m.25057 type:complete len:240 (-) Transcript_6944:1466-2185(-)
MATFSDLSTSKGLKELDAFLLTKSYISGYQASRDDLAVFGAMAKAPSAKEYPHAARWYAHIQALLGESFPGEGKGVGLSGASAAAGAPAPAAKIEVDSDSDSDSDSDLDLFGEMTEEEKAAAEKKKAVIAAAKARAAEKEKKCKSLIVMDIKPWDDETDLGLMEKKVRAITYDGLLWGSSKLVTFAFGMKKLQMTAVIEDTKIPSFDEIIEKDILLLDEDEEVQSEEVQSVDILSFNKL